MLEELGAWLGGEVLEWVCGFYETSKAGTEETRKILKPTFARFEFHISKSLGALRSGPSFHQPVW